MRVTERVRNVMRAALQRHGPAGLKRALWNREFATGRWDCLDSSVNDCVYPFVEKHARDGSILDLGSGSGSTASELRLVYRRYTGVDISDVAIRQAIQTTRANGRDRVNRFVRSDIETFIPDEKYNVILFRDSIYYLSAARMVDVLRRYAAHLADEGVFIVRMWGSAKNHEIVGRIEKHFEIVEKFSQENPTAQVLIFR